MTTTAIFAAQCHERFRYWHLLPYMTLLCVFIYLDLPSVSVVGLLYKYCTV